MCGVGREFRFLIVSCPGVWRFQLIHSGPQSSVEVWGCRTNAQSGYAGSGGSDLILSAPRAPRCWPTRGVDGAGTPPYIARTSGCGGGEGSRSTPSRLEGVVSLLPPPPKVRAMKCGVPPLPPRAVPLAPDPMGIGERAERGGDGTGM